MNRIELLAPVGNKQTFYTAIANGADAVYMGGKNFSARAFADNFDHDDFKELIEYAHLRNVRVYVTLNTLLNEFEFKNAIEDVRFYYENGVDALIIQDLGLYYWIKQNYPDFELHASTQMHIHNLSGVQTANKLGFSRVVIARESNLDLIKQVCKEDIEIEVFVHGALCVSYSGQCLLSSSSKSRSANKGMCAQCCRLKYELLDSQKNRIQTETDYLLSPKDMFLLEDVDKLIEAGVSSLKIEGRMKSSAYVGYTTRMYRKAIDSYYANKEFKLTNEEKKNLKVLFNRGYTNTFLFDKKEDIFKQNSPNHQGISIGTVISSNGKRVKIKLTDSLNQFDGVRIYSKYFDDGFVVNKLYRNGLLVNSAKSNDEIELESSHIFKKGDLLLKTLNKQLEDSINSENQKYIPVDLKIEIKTGLPVTVSCNGFIYKSNIIAQEAINAPLNKELVFKQFSKLKDTPYHLNSIELNIDNSFLRNSELNEIRNSFVKYFNEFRIANYHRKNEKKVLVEFENIKSEDFKEDFYFQENRINEFKFSPVINISSNYSEGNLVVTELGGLLIKNNKLAYYTLNISNSYAYELLKKIDFSSIVLSSELNSLEIKELIKSYIERNNVSIKPIILYSGKRTLMYIRNNPFAKYSNASYLINSDCFLSIKYNNDYIELQENYESNYQDNDVNRLINNQ